MQIDRDLNLVIEIEGASGVVHLHSMPIAREVFKAHYRLIARTHSEIEGLGLAYKLASGPKVAAMTLRDVGRRNAVEWGERDAQGQLGDGGAAAFLNEVKRLTNVAVPGPRGYDVVPVDVALGTKALGEEDWDEAENKIVFFTLLSVMESRSSRRAIVERFASIMRARAVSSNATEYTASLQTSTPAETSAPAPAPSARPAGLSVPH